MKPVKLGELEKRIEYSFEDKNKLLLAMTHSSYANEHKGRKKENNERLEFLGDAVLEITVSDYLFRTYPEYAEGKLTKLRSSLVCEYTLSICARDVKVCIYLLLSNGQYMTAGRER
ncbi:MAG: ribonuclease III, partial [Clostridiales bacterium]|nr:ribonuclease III [Clostridiales bacterium]